MGTVVAFPTRPKIQQAWACGECYCQDRWILWEDGDITCSNCDNIAPGITTIESEIIASVESDQPGATT